MKRIASALLSVALIFGLCACGAPAGSKASNGDVKTETAQPSDNPIKKELPANKPAEPTPAESTGMSDTPEKTEAPAEPSPADETAIDGIHPEFKATMDSYEAFFNEYAELMKAVSENPSDISLMMKYAEFMGKYAEMLDALENIDESELSTAELSYYIEVTARIEQKLLSAIS